MKREQALVPVGFAAGIAAYFRGLRMNESGGRGFRHRQARVRSEGTPLVGVMYVALQFLQGKFTRIGEPFIRACEV